MTLLFPSCPVRLVESVLGIHMKFDDMKLNEKVGQWNVRILEVRGSEAEGGVDRTRTFAARFPMIARGHCPCYLCAAKSSA